MLRNVLKAGQGSVESDLTLAQRQARFIAKLEFQDLPPDVVAQAKNALLDYLGVALRGSTLPQGRPGRSLVDALDTRPEATIIGGGRAAVAYAAFLNATYGHSLEYDDSHIDCCRAGTMVVPAALAMAERERLGGRELLTAIVAGYQVMVWSIGAINTTILDIGWHGMKVGGPFAVAATAAKLLDLSEEQIAHALAIAGSEASGTTEYNQSGGNAKRYHAGMAARSGIEAALLAQAGLTGPLTIYEGERGILRLFGAGKPGSGERFWDGSFHITRNMYKLYPAVGTLHAPLDALEIILRRRPGSPSADDIHRIDVRMADWAVRHSTKIKRPTDMTGAQFSLGFALALKVVRGSTGIDDFADPANWTDRELLGLLDKVCASAMPVPEAANEMYGDVTVHWTDGTSDHAFVPVPRGFWTNPASAGDLRAKFRDVTAGQLSLEAAERVIEGVDRAEDMSDVTELWKALLHD